MQLVQRCPALFAFSPEALGATMGAISALTGLQPHQLPQLVAADPSLLLQPDRLKANMRGLAQALGVPLPEIVSLASREPAVLALSGAEAEARVEAVAGLLLPQDGSAVALTRALLDAPGALLQPEPSELEGQLRALEAALGPVVGPSGRPTAPCSSASPSTQPAAADANTRPQAERGSAPPCSGEASCSVRGSVEGGCRAEGSGGEARTVDPALRQAVAAVVLARPSLLGTPPEILAGRVAHLARKAGVPGMQVLHAVPAGPNLLAASSCFVDRHCAALAQTLGLEQGGPGALRRDPALTSGILRPSSTTPSATPSTIPSTAASAARTPSPAATSSGSASTSAPSGALASDPTIAAAVAAAAAACAAAEAEAEAARMLVARPELLGQHVTALAAKWQLLGGLLGSDPAWARAVADTGAGQRAELLALPYTTVARLRYLADRGLQASVQPLEAVRLSDALFHYAHPGFKDWLRG
ncbi:hypothetical protein HYH03_010699 [Edaphochlamys debaryana]|uniref:Uncharacterized protein n=1 Tax=Edaphochlamys debaryana TaxID=47281 RepID=A0A835XYJ2_9CHLO|nr:hypothetical protein HYH03_010699 [Edaphochlamys debaryana]|eukprot:KAG2490776.1 hypothetical protein HYH03_010699 [Edaphochlamys debaryana]